MADKLNKTQRDARTQQVKALLNIARAWEGPNNNDYAAQLRAEARMKDDDPDFADMVKQAARYTEIANTVTAETEARHDRQSAKAKKRRPRPWHVAAAPILDELRGKHPDWNRSDLRCELKKRLEKLKANLPSNDAIDAHIKQREEDGSLAKGQNKGWR